MMTGKPENMARAKELGWVSPNHDSLIAMKWSPEGKKRELDNSIPEACVVQAKEMLVNVTKLYVVLW